MTPNINCQFEFKKNEKNKTFGEVMEALLPHRVIEVGEGGTALKSLSDSDLQLTMTIALHLEGTLAQLDFGDELNEDSFA